MRVEVYYRQSDWDPRIGGIERKLGFAPGAVRIFTADVFLLDSEDLPESLLRQVFQDPVVQDLSLGPSCDRLLPGWNVAFEVAYRRGVTDPLAETARKALGLKLGRPGPEVQSARLYVFAVEGRSVDWERTARQFYNPLIQDARFYTPEQGPAAWATTPAAASVPRAPEPEVIPILGLDEDSLVRLSEQRLLALNREEMRAIQAYYARDDVQRRRAELGLPSEPTDVELEMLAQSWSEHCKHKIFQARIDYTDEHGRATTIHSLFQTYIKSVTDALWDSRPFLRSVFRDNSGVIALDAENLVCFKVETHNSPSALDPFGGAITGIVGVNRDILGTGLGAKPIWNTDVLCFAPPDFPEEKVPTGLLSPRRVLEGVHQGIVEGGNHSGIPTVAGAFLFDESYLGKPLVFCGTGGWMKATVAGRPTHEKRVSPGSYAVMCGGRIGKDGIHGATFSSLALDETSPTSAVQIGDPIVQKVMADFLLEARDLGLYEAITDNGAGGLSSSLGEMAQDCGGLRVDLDACPLKYPGLAAWEIWVSESQERMSLAVPPRHWETFRDLALRRGVEVARVGEFTDSGWIELYHRGRPVGLLSLDFVHRGCPLLHLRAVWTPRDTRRGPLGAVDPRDLLFRILEDPNVASKESLIRQYDHEVQGRSLTRPFSGVAQDAPSDGAVLRLFPGAEVGITVTHGICPRVGDADTWAMAACAVDEAYRAHVALGGDPEFAAILDNFCWPDPIAGPRTPDGEYKLAQLVRACQGLHEAALSYGLPIISGKDSMKNDAWVDGRKISVRPTLLVSLVGKAEARADLPDTDFLEAGDLILLAGPTRAHFAGSMAERVLGVPLAGVPTPDFRAARLLFGQVHEAIQRGVWRSVHDLGDGGLAVALVESCLGGRLGADVDLAGVCARTGLSPAEVLFSESPSRFLLSVSPDREAEALALLEGSEVQVLGRTTSVGRLAVRAGDRPLFQASLDELLARWKSWEGRWP